LAFDCSPAVIAPAFRSRTLTPELFGAGGGLCARATEQAPIKASAETKLKIDRFKAILLK
jgi:hypothetical protein